MIFITPGMGSAVIKYGLYYPNDYQMFMPIKDELLGGRAISNLFSNARAKAFV